MASEAYKKLLREIPVEIQQKVKRSLGVADEIHKILLSQGKSPAELARIMNKSESEISKWLTGTHNFTQKTIDKIEEALGERIYYFKSELDKKNEEILRLKNSISTLEKELAKQKMGLQVYIPEFNEVSSFSTNSKLAFPNFEGLINDKAFGWFITGKSDRVRIKPVKSGLQHVCFQND